MKTYEDGLRDGVRFVLTHYEQYHWSSEFAHEVTKLECSDPLSDYHKFGKHVLVMVPHPINRLPKSAEHLEHRIKAITSSAFYALT